METELWDIYDRKTGRFVRQISKGDGPIPDDQYHETVEVIATDKQGAMLIVPKNAAIYEFPAASVLSGEEPRHTAKRKLMEKTGLKPKTTYKISEGFAPGLKRYVYLAFVPDLRRQMEHVTDGSRLVTVDEWLTVIANGAFNTSRAAAYDKKFLNTLKKMTGFQDEDGEKSVLRVLPRVKPVSDDKLAANQDQDTCDDIVPEDSSTDEKEILGFYKFRDSFYEIIFTDKEREDGFFL